MSVIYIVRHGQSEGNIRGGFAGRMDYPLSDLGQKQARMTADYLHDAHIEFVLSSTLSRAVATAQPIADDRGLSVIRRADLMEMDFGDWEGLPIDEVEKMSPGAVSRWKTELHKTDCPNGESMADCFARAKNALCGIAREYEGHDICMVSHGALIKCMLCYLHGFSLCEIQNAIWADNASVTKLEYADGKFAIDYEGYSAHMGEFVTGISKALNN